ncbi:ribonuclease III [Halocola ammonii]
MWNISWFKKTTDREKQVSQFIKNSFGFKPKQLDYYVQALRHSSASKSIARGVKNSNERLEFLGDAILDAVLADYLYANYPKTPEGQLTKMKAKVVSRKYLNVVGEKIELDKNLQLNLGKQELQKSLVGNALEAVIGAIYLDKGYDFASRVTLELLKKYDLEKKVHATTDFKSKLHEWCQKHRKSLTFEMVKEELSNGKSTYEMAVKVEGTEAGRGIGTNKKLAEQQAAKKALKKLVRR